MPRDEPVPLQQNQLHPSWIMEYVPGGTIFYFKENRQNTVVLLYDPNEWRAIQEK